MASRCIKALNELDAISDKVFYKYSKNRFKSEIEGRIRASKSRVEHYDQNYPSNNGTRRGSSPSLNTQGSPSSSSTTKARETRSAANPKTSHAEIIEQKERAKTTSYYRKRVTKTAPSNKNVQTQEAENKSKIDTGKTPSVFGKHNQEEEKSKPDKWFNFEDGVKMGRIDSFVCDERNQKALCYSLDKKKSKPVPKLLRHRLDVRIGRNGEVRNTDVEVKENGSKETRYTSTSTVIPLSWEEQLNWENACIKTPRPPSQKKAEDKGLCEMHPVIFNPEERPTTVSSNAYTVSDDTAAYRMFLDRRLLVSDRGNLICDGKCITSVELEDARDEIEETKRLRIVNSSLKAYVVDDDRMDMSTISNIDNIYPRRSAASKSSSVSNSENVLVENPFRNSDSAELHQHILQSKDPERNDKISKRVSFKDQINITEKHDSSKDLDVDINIVQKANMGGFPAPKQRPKSSKERTGFSFELKETPKRPYTAPPCSPRLTQDENFEAEISRHFILAPIRVTTSDVITSKNVKDKTVEEKGEESSTLENDSEVNFSDRNTTESEPAMRVSVACKSAPSVRRTPRMEEPISRSLSSMCARTNKNKYVPPEPIAVLADSSMELPPNLPPAQALVELRKKIREDLAKETADLQLDIQQLYLKHHANS